MSISKTFSTDAAVRERYANAARQPEAALCCPVEYNKELLKVLPDEVIEKDYGCGDPSQHIRAGETVLDLGSGTGKICFMAAQVVGPFGRVIGVDMTDEMLEVARRNAPTVAERIGFANVDFRKGRIQDLSLDLEALDLALEGKSFRGTSGYIEAEEIADDLRRCKPLVASESIDVVVSNCVLNLVNAHYKEQLFHEIYRVLKIGGRAVISDIISDQPSPAELRNDPELWSGCISGALTEEEFLRGFHNAGFEEAVILKREEKPWRVVRGINFRSITVEARKGHSPAKSSSAFTVHFKRSCC